MKWALGSMNENVKVSRLQLKNGRVGGYVKGLSDLCHEYKFKGLVVLFISFSVELYRSESSKLLCLVSYLR